MTYLWVGRSVEADDMTPNKASRSHKFQPRYGDGGSFSVSCTARQLSGGQVAFSTPASYGYKPGTNATTLGQVPKSRSVGSIGMDILSLLTADFCVSCVPFFITLRILTSQSWLFWGPDPYYTGSNPSIGGSNDPSGNIIFICYEKRHSAPDSPYIGMFVSGDFSQSSSQATPISSARGLVFLFRKRTLSSRDTCGSCTLLEPKTKESWHQPSCSHPNAYRFYCPMEENCRIRPSVWKMLQINHSTALHYNV